MFTHFKTPRSRQNARTEILGKGMAADKKTQLKIGIETGKTISKLKDWRKLKGKHTHCFKYQSAQSQGHRRGRSHKSKEEGCDSRE